ncbi:MAG: MMPL family transporter [Fuerstiella sp.]
MFQTLGNIATRHASIVVAVWLLLLAVSFYYVPEWSTVAENGEFAFLPDDSPSVEAEQLFRKYFPEHTVSSNIVLVVRRETSEKGLRDEDFRFIGLVLIPRLCRMFGLDEDTGVSLTPEDVPESERPLVKKLSWSGTRNTGPLYDSLDGKASLIVLELRTEFLDQDNLALIDQIEEEIDQWRRVAYVPENDEPTAESGSGASPAAVLSTDTVTQTASPASVGASGNGGAGNGASDNGGSDNGPDSSGTGADSSNSTASDPNGTQADEPVAAAPPDTLQKAIPQGLDITFSGTATYGRDAIRESDRSAKSTERWTVILVVVLLLAMYRAPLLTLVPLLTVAVAATLSINLLAIGAKLGWVRLFNGIEPYITVLVYGAGVDYCLFLIARYREELDSGSSIEEGILVAMTRVGSALAASAGTTMCGIGMMAFAQFGKFEQAGIAISFGLFVCLMTSLTLAPAVLRLFGRWAFWPNIPARESSRGEWVTRASIFSRLMKLRLLNDGWKRIGQVLLRSPRTMWLGSIAAMLPFAIAGVVFYGDLSYGLLTDLPSTAHSVRGARALQAHFPGGEGVPVRVLLDVPGRDYARPTPRPPEDIVELTRRILEAKDELGIQAVRSLADITGGRDLGISSRFLRARALQEYATRENPSITRMDLIFRNDAFSRTSIGEFRHLRRKLPELLPESMQGASLWFAGETASLSDLKAVTDHDRSVINSLVVIVVFAILWLLLRRPWICSYLMLTVLFSYFATLGCTFLFFWALDPTGFAGLDWKVPMFLFTILIAVGEDYNIFLLTRIDEESRQHGPVKGIIVALDRTGSIISSCGIIMAGTFSSLAAGSLVGMDQLGFALALGVILDTFVVRPIMVPAFLIMLAKRRVAAAAVADSPS